MDQDSNRTGQDTYWGRTVDVVRTPSEVGQLMWRQESRRQVRTLEELGQ